MRNVHLVVRPLNEREIPDHVEDKVLAKAYLETAYGLDSDMEVHGWDQPPLLYIFRLKRRDESIGSALIMDGRPVPGFHQLVSKYMSQGGRMHHALLHVAEAWNDLIKMFRHREFLNDIGGVALVHEGWGLLHDDLTDGDRDAADRREIHLHPKRVEIRMVHIAGPSGLRVALSHPRDGVPMQLMGQARPFGPAHEHGSGGDVPNALHYLYETVTGQEPGEWSTWWKQYDY